MVSTCQMNRSNKLYAEFIRRYIQEQEDKQSRASLPVEITTELENVSEQQQDENFKRFRKECKRYELDKWTTPERINSELYKEINKHKSDTSDVISKIYEITETTRFQAKFTAQIYEQLQYVLQQSSNLDEARAIIQRTTDQSKRLAIFGFSQAKNQERVARNYAIDAINIPASIRYQVPKKENYKTTNAFSDEFMYPLSHARFEQDLQKTTNNKDKGRGGYNNNGYRGQSRGGYRRRGRPHFFEERGNNTTTYNQNNNQSQQ